MAPADEVQHPKHNMKVKTVVRSKKLGLGQATDERLQTSAMSL